MEFIKYKKHKYPEFLDKSDKIYFKLKYNFDETQINQYCIDLIAKILLDQKLIEDEIQEIVKIKFIIDYLKDKNFIDMTTVKTYYNIICNGVNQLKTKGYWKESLKESD